VETGRKLADLLIDENMYERVLGLRFGSSGSTKSSSLAWSLDKIEDNRAASSGNSNRSLCANARNFKTRGSKGRDVVVRRRLGVDLL
jgi:hypothetical protein